MQKEKRLRGAKHNQSKTKLFERWASMHARCKQGHKLSEHYFDRDITVCNGWDSFVAFKEWAESNGFSKELQLDRKDNDKGYHPDNCRWVTRIVNNSNRGITIIVNYQGEDIPLSLLAIQLNLDKKLYRNVRDRLSRGWTIENALNEPIQTKIKHERVAELVDAK